MVVEWLRILPTQGTGVRSLVWEEPPSRRATRTTRHNSRARVLRLPDRTEPARSQGSQQWNPAPQGRRHGREPAHGKETRHKRTVHVPCFTCHPLTANNSWLLVDSQTRAATGVNVRTFSSPRKEAHALQAPHPHLSPPAPGNHSSAFSLHTVARSGRYTEKES